MTAEEFLFLLGLMTESKKDQPGSCKSGVEIILLFRSRDHSKRKDFFLACVEDKTYENHVGLFMGFYKSYDLCKPAAKRSTARASGDSLSYIKDWNKMVKNREKL